jgi:teichoic acid transport system ATP-binding protein
LLDVFSGAKNYTLKTATDHVSFVVKRGESVAILGLNGAGKSTMLKMITGVVFPTTGEVKINGRVSALLELTAGFDDMFTGRENIYIKGMLLGLGKPVVRELEDKIINFADIGEYIDQPVRTYSSGMKARLGFAINANIDPDILVIDEALSVGDKNFQNKCRDKIKEIRSREHVTVLLVTHSTKSAEEICDRGIILESGKLAFDGPIKKAIKYYEKAR